MKKMKVIWHPDSADKPLRLQSESRFVSLDIVFNNGRTLSKRQDARSRKNLREEEVYDKYRNNARMAGISEEKIDQSVALVKTMEECENVTELINLVCAFGDVR